MSDSERPHRRQPTSLPVPGILQARTLEWVAISFSNAWNRKVKVKLLSRVWPSATPWTVAHQVSPSMGFSRQEYWSGVPLPSPVKMLTALKCLFQSLLMWTNKKCNHILPLINILLLASKDNILIFFAWYFLNCWFPLWARLYPPQIPALKSYIRMCYIWR